MHAHMVEYGELDEENKQEDGHDDLLQAFLAEALNVRIRTKGRQLMVF